MNLSSDGHALIKRWEGYRGKAYRPLAHDVWTIGWGHTRTVYPGMTVTKEQAGRLFLSDVRPCERCVLRRVKVSLNQSQFDALVSFIFNLGEGNFRKSTLLRELNRGNYDRVPDQLKRWVNSGPEEDVPGLIARRQSEINVWNTLDEVEHVASNTVPSAPMGQPVGQLLKTSKTTQGGAIVSLASVTALVSEVKDLSSENSGIIASLQSQLDNPLMVVALVGVMIGGFIIYNRRRDSRMGRAY